MSDPDNRSNFRIISTFLYDPHLPAFIAQHGDNHYPEPRDSPCYLIKFQLDRMLDAATHFKWEKVVALLRPNWEDLLKKILSEIPNRDCLWRVSLHLDVDGHHYLSTTPVELSTPLSFYLPRSLDERPDHVDVRPWQLFVDSEHTMPSPFTLYKTTERQHCNVAFNRGILGRSLDSTICDVLLLNPHGEVMEATRTTPYFQRRRTKDVSTDSLVTDLNWVTPPLSSGGNASTTRRFALEAGLCLEEVVRVQDLVDGELCWLSNAVRGFVPAQINLSQKRSEET